ncbi:GNAT family N-acetyltransferase [Deinococcus ficus]|uniref:GNAT family N-acetyltransferase n=1 Tax=Deinococcus ficus TaxID=317577 RepID=UPI0003B37A3E|nr:GNAT family N-acetyltransferase [Deinococcus ficus]
MIRPMQHTDTPDVLTLLHWMDGAPEREVFAPDARDPHELRMEVEDSRCYVTDGPDGVDAYCGISPFRDGMILEGPVGHDPARMKNLIERAVKDAEGLPVYAFCSRDNTLVRDALEAAGLNPMHSTAFYSAPISALQHARPLPPGYTFSDSLGFTEYRDLYRAAEDAWADRLEWTPEEYDAHFRHGDVRLVALRREGRPVGFAELELCPEESRADLTYLAVHPAERGRGYSRALVAQAARVAGQDPTVKTLRARAHDHMHSARALYTKLGLNQCRSIVTYMKEAEEEA